MSQIEQAEAFASAVAREVADLYHDMRRQYNRMAIPAPYRPPLTRQQVRQAGRRRRVMAAREAVARRIAPWLD